MIFVPCFFDYRKAFDSVPHRHLLQKLKSLSINSYLLRWLYNYLYNRHQCVCVNGASSNRLPVTSGVPQGSVLGPILFVIYINDIDSVHISEGNKTMFADDVMLYRPLYAASDLAIVQSDIDNLLSWSDTNFLDYNTSKCKYMIITRKNKSDQVYTQTKLSIKGVVLDRVDSYKYLGVWITADLTWSKHVTEICHKARQKVGVLYRNCYQHAGSQTIFQLYLSCIRPDVEYAVPVWSPHQKYLIHMLEAIQKFALRVCSKQWKAEYSTLLAMYSIPTLESRRTYLRLSYLFNLLKGNYLVPSPSPLEIRNFEHYSRSHELTLRVPFARATSYFYSFFCDAPRLWNDLPEDVVSVDNLESFKGRLLQHLCN